jgi:2,4'-dihydroxyacetophenone dioxygenase
MPFPMLVNNHHELLTLNMNELPMYEDALPGVDAQPLFLDTHRNQWVLRVRFHPGCQLPAHYHTGAVHIFTTKGRWMYAEYPDQPQTAGCYLYEPGSSVHTFVVPADATEPAEQLVIVEGANVNFDADGNYVGMLDANSITLIIENLVKTRGLKPARYIRPQLADYTTSGKSEGLAK